MFLNNLLYKKVILVMIYLFSKLKILHFWVPIQVFIARRKSIVTGIKANQTDSAEICKTSRTEVQSMRHL